MNSFIHTADLSSQDLYTSCPSTHIVVDEGTPEGQKIWLAAEGNVDAILNQFIGRIVVLVLRCRSIHEIDWSTVDTSRLIIRDLCAGYDSVYKKNSHGFYPSLELSLFLCPDSWSQRKQYQRTPSTYLWLPTTDRVSHNIIYRLDTFHRTTQSPKDHALISIICPPSIVNHFFPLIQWANEGGINISLVCSSTLMPHMISEETIGALYESGRIWLCCDWMYATKRLQNRENLINSLGFSCLSIPPQRHAIRSFNFWDAHNEIYNHEYILATITNHHSRKQAIADKEKYIANQR